MAAIFASTTLWTAIATLILFYILHHYGVFGKIGAGLDKRAQRISSELEEARRLRAEAEALLLEFERKRERAEGEAAEIVAAAREEAERISREAEIRLTDFIARRTASAEAKIAQAETQAMIEVRDAAISAAVAASETVLRGSVQGQLGGQLIKDGLSDVKRQLS
jgi:F-type H+-transporting ATPase subunit b